MAGKTEKKKSAGAASLRAKAPRLILSASAVSEQETRQESFLKQGQETLQECLPPRGQKAIKEFFLPQGRESAASSACGFFAAAKDRAAVNQEAGDFPSRNSLLLFVAAKEFVALDGGNHADRAFFT